MNATASNANSRIDLPQLRDRARARRLTGLLGPLGDSAG
jgi:hypothetical protein